MSGATPGRLSVLLIDTNPEGQNGSMAQYGDMVVQALSGYQEKQCISVDRISLSLPTLLLDLLPQSLRYRVNHFWMMSTAGMRLRRRRADIFHLLDGSYAYVAGLLRGRPLAITVHDVIPALQDIGLLSPPPGRNGRWIIRRSLRALESAKKIIADSRNTTTDLGRVAKVSADRISIIYPALARHFSRLQDGSRIIHKGCSGNDAYILHVGNNAFYKNRTGVLKIFSLISKKYDLTLKMAGPPPTFEMKALVSTLGVSGRVEFVVDPHSEKLAGLYRGASLFLFPSLYEGFGWPPLEAMACGCPVVCSDAASLPEVVGVAALKCPPEDEQQFALKCLSVLSDEGLAEDLVQKGFAQAAKFSLERMGKELLSVYEEVLGVVESKE